MMSEFSAPSKEPEESCCRQKRKASVGRWVTAVVTWATAPQPRPPPLPPAGWRERLARPPWHLWEAQTMCWDPGPGQTPKCHGLQPSLWKPARESSHFLQKASCVSNKTFHIFLMCVVLSFPTFKPHLWWESILTLWGTSTAESLQTVMHFGGKDPVNDPRWFCVLLPFLSVSVERSGGVVCFGCSSR